MVSHCSFILHFYSDDIEHIHVIFPSSLVSLARGLINFIDLKELAIHFINFFYSFSVLYFIDFSLVFTVLIFFTYFVFYLIFFF